jgi:hypothetical protein
LTEGRGEKQISSINYILKGYELGYFLFDVKSVVSVVGQAIAIKIAFDKLVKLRKKNLYFCIQFRPSWNLFITLITEAVSELKF